jgi:Tfp pilus assembly PilM family ATPase
MEKNNSASCNEVLENIRRSLYKCSDNYKIHTIDQTVLLAECSNIQHFSEFVKRTTEIQIVWVNPTIEKNSFYSIQYNVKDRLLRIDS